MFLTRWCIAAVLLVLMAAGGGVMLDGKTASAQSAPPAAAARPSTDVFTVQNVPVDATATNPIAAREAAITDGQRRALRMVLERLTSPSDYARLPRPTDDQIGEIVRDFEVANERGSAVRYIGTYTFRFRPEAVRRLLTDVKIPFVEGQIRRVVVIPVLTSPAGAVLWDDPNPWRQAWATRKAEGLIETVLPVGDLSDMAMIDGPQAIAGKPDALSAVGRRYGGIDVLVAEGASTALEAASAPLEVTLRRFSSGQLSASTATSVAVKPGESVGDFMARAVAESLSALDQTWKRDNVVQFDQQGNLVAVVPLNGLSDLVAVRERLVGVTAIRQVDLLSVTRREAKLDIRYAGDPMQMKAMLAQRSLSLEQADDVWTLRVQIDTPTTAAPGAAPAPAPAPATAP